MPLLWTHAEFLKLLVARDAGKPVELLKSVEDRYGVKPRTADTWHWRAEAPVTRLALGRTLAIEHRSPFVLRYGFDGWRTVGEKTATDGPFGLWAARLVPEELEAHGVIDFTRRFEHGWEGVDYHVTIGHAKVEHTLTHQAS